MTLDIPDSFRRMPRWRQGGTTWLDELPRRVTEQCARWNLRLDDAEVRHGSNALVVPVCRGDIPLALRLTPPQDPVADQVAALRFWAGRGTVRLRDSDVGAGALLLERLDARHTLADLPLAEAVPLIAAMMVRLAVPAPPEAPATSALVTARSAALTAEWDRLGKPFDSGVLATALAAGRRLAGSRTAASRTSAAVNGDLHYDQVLSGSRERWLVVDPVLLRGDVEYDLARVLWTRLDEMPTSTEIRQWFEVAVDAARLNPERAVDWVVFRSVDYWLWGLGNGLTEDPRRCQRLLEAMVG